MERHISWTICRHHETLSLTLYRHVPGTRMFSNVVTVSSPPRNLTLTKWCYLTYGWRRQWHPTPGLLPGKSHGQRSLVGCSPWGSQRVRHNWVTSLSRIGEGNGNPFQGSCLENPRDGGAWWAAVYGVAQRLDTTEVTTEVLKYYRRTEVAAAAATYS